MHALGYARVAMAMAFDVAWSCWFVVHAASKTIKNYSQSNRIAGVHRMVVIGAFGRMTNATWRQVHQWETRTDNVNRVRGLEILTSTSLYPSFEPIAQFAHFSSFLSSCIASITITINGTHHCYRYVRNISIQWNTKHLRSSLFFLLVIYFSFVFHAHSSDFISQFIQQQCHKQHTTRAAADK